MPVNSKGPVRGSRAESLLPNLFPQLKLLEIRIVGVNRADEVSTFDILAWAFRDDRLVPTTLRGVLEPKEGCHYAIFNADDKTHTSLDGTQYRDYKSFMAPKWQAFEQSLPVEPQEPEPSPQPRASADPQPWKEVRK